MGATCARVGTRGQRMSRSRRREDPMASSKILSPTSIMNDAILLRSIVNKDMSASRLFDQERRPIETEFGVGTDKLLHGSNTKPSSFSVCELSQGSTDKSSLAAYHVETRRVLTCPADHIENEDASDKISTETKASTMHSTARHPAPWSPEDLVKLYRMRVVEGVSTQGIAQALGRTHQALRKRLSTGGWYHRNIAPVGREVGPPPPEYMPARTVPALYFSSIHALQEPVSPELKQEKRRGRWPRNMEDPTANTDMLASSPKSESVKRTIFRKDPIHRVMRSESSRPLVATHTHIKKHRIAKTRKQSRIWSEEELTRLYRALVLENQRPDDIAVALDRSADAITSQATGRNWVRCEPPLGYGPPGDPLGIGDMEGADQPLGFNEDN